MAESLDDAKKKLDDEYGQVRRKFDRIHTAFDRVVSAGPDDDVYDSLKELEKVVKEVRDGGVFGSGANGHRRALKEYEETKAASGG
jgi:hypothetical protein